jgi:hypothetical protein
MHSGSFNVISITSGGFTLLDHFLQLFEVLTPVQNRRQGALNSPQPFKHYTKAALKANLLAV